MNVQELLLHAVNGVIRNLEDIGPPLNPMLVTDKGIVLFLDEPSCKQPEIAAHVELHRLLKTQEVRSYVLVIDSKTSFEGGEPIDGVHFVPGDQHEDKQDAYFLPYLIRGDKGVVAEPPQLYVVGTSNSLFKASIQTSLQPQTIWKANAQQE